MKDSYSVIAKPVGPICNLACRYCFYLRKKSLYPEEKSWAMPQAVLENFIRRNIQAQDAEPVLFIWQGGEPTLLGVRFFREAVALQKKWANGKRIENALQTNGILLNDEWGGFLAENHFLVGVSVDGPAPLHDPYRTGPGGEATLDRVMQGLRCLQKHKAEFNTLTVVNRINEDQPLAVYRFLKEAGSRFMQFIPLVEREADQESRHGPVEAVQVTAESVRPAALSRFLCVLFDEWVRKDVGRIFVQTFDVALEAWCGMPSSLCTFSETCGRAPALEHNGDLYACDHYVSPEYRLGNIGETPLDELVFSERQVRFGQDKKDRLPSFCRKCKFLFACNGDCPKHRFASAPDGEAGLSYLCEAYRAFFTHVDPYMRFMARELQAGRPPANVMDWAGKKDAGFPDLKTDRNAPCPCGSGKKYKHCCGSV
ncbi:anaerobic sulfatase maturase [bacterium]|nr:anaerobic sulfatase maturase [bacterium]